MVFVFEDFSLDADRRELRRKGNLLPLEPQVFDLLLYLVQNRDRVVSKDDVLAAVWDGRLVSESTLTSRMNSVRSANGDTGEQQRLVRTIPRKGFRFVGDVREELIGMTNAPTISARAAARPPDKPSIAVLPFTNMSGDTEQEYFSDGDHNRPLAPALVLRDRPQLHLCLQRKSSRREAGRARARRALRAGG